MEILSIYNFLFKKFEDYSEIITFAKDCDGFNVNHCNSFTRYLFKDSKDNKKLDDDSIIVSFRYDNCEFDLKYTAITKKLISFYISSLCND